MMAWWKSHVLLMMVQVTTPGNAAQLGIDFADYYEASALRQYVP